ncbi:filamentous hemagglutinin N-terminal domain-containing protein [Campylobacter sp. MG1]|uniref:filamentous hemagglutinin N-terminal domain-containing protein n=1 Tax=Campylobacter sp. MG1 TaxID=2976332 RepID=UPI00226CAA95|nr:filamentous hemagglutinin N-terminal domain-containing protein [Campylobacter sp. MG1]
MASKVKQIQKMKKNKIKLTKSLVVTLLITGEVAFGLPIGENVISGKVDIIREGNKLTIKNSDGSIIDWKNFDTYKDEIVKFLQENSNSRVLNRVLDGKETFFDGLLQSNANVYLINTSGIVFGQNARIDTKSLVASSLDISNKDFLDKKDIFAGNNGAKVENQGLIIVQDGKLALIGNEIKNSGIVKAENGNILLAAGTKVTIQDLKNRAIAYEIQAPNGKVINLGDIIAKNGKIDIRGKNIKIGGIVSTNGQAITIGNRNETTDLKIEKNTNISSSADKNAGDILMWGDNAEYSGKYSATSKDGNGGLIETSGKNIKINDDVKVDTRSQNAKTGTWLIDPINITIVDGENDNKLTGGTIKNKTIVEGLKGTNVTITTEGTGTDEGKIDVNADIIANDDNTNDLTFKANTSINIKGINNGNLHVDMKGGALNLEVGKDLNIADAEIAVGKQSTWNINGKNITYSGKIVKTSGDINIENVYNGVFDADLIFHKSGSLNVIDNDSKSGRDLFVFKKSTFALGEGSNIYFLGRYDNHHNGSNKALQYNYVFDDNITVSGKGKITFDIGSTLSYQPVGGFNFKKTGDMTFKVSNGANLVFDNKHYYNHGYDFSATNLIFDTAKDSVIDMKDNDVVWEGNIRSDRYYFDKIIHKGEGTANAGFSKNSTRIGVGEIINEAGEFTITANRIVSKQNTNPNLYDAITEDEKNATGITKGDLARDFIVDQKIGDIKDTTITNTSGNLKIEVKDRINANTITNNSTGKLEVRVVDGGNSTVYDNTKTMNVNSIINNNGEMVVYANRELNNDNITNNASMSIEAGDITTKKITNTAGDLKITSRSTFDIGDTTNTSIDIQSGNALIQVQANGAGSATTNLKLGGNINIGQDAKLELLSHSTSKETDGNLGANKDEVYKETWNSNEAATLKSDVNVTNSGLFVFAPKSGNVGLNMDNHSLTIDGGTNILEFMGYKKGGIDNAGDINLNNANTYVSAVASTGTTKFNNINVDNSKFTLTTGMIFGESITDDKYQNDLDRYINKPFRDAANNGGKIELSGSITATKNSNVDIRAYNLITNNTAGVNIVNNGDASNTLKLQAFNVTTTGGAMTIDKWDTPDLTVGNLNKNTADRNNAKFEVKNIKGNDFTFNILDKGLTGGTSSDAKNFDGTFSVSNKDGSDVNLTVKATDNTPLDFNANIANGGNIKAVSGKNIVARGDLTSTNGDITIEATKIEKKSGNYNANNVTFTATTEGIILNGSASDKIDAKEKITLSANKGIDINAGELVGKGVDITATTGNIAVGTSTIKSKDTSGSINITADKGNVNIKTGSVIGDTTQNGVKADVNITATAGTATTNGTTLDGKNVTIKGDTGTTVNTAVTASENLIVGEKATTTVKGDLTAGEKLTITGEKDINLNIAADSKVTQTLKGKNVTIESTAGDVNIGNNNTTSSVKINSDVGQTTSGTINITGKNVTLNENTKIGDESSTNKDDIVIKANGTEVDASAPDDMTKNKGIATISTKLDGKNVTVDGVNKTLINKEINATENVTLGGKDNAGNIRGEVKLAENSNISAEKNINLYTAENLALNKITLESKGAGTIFIEGKKSINVGDGTSNDTKLFTKNGIISIKAGENIDIKDDTSVGDSSKISSLVFEGKNVTVGYEPGLETNDINITATESAIFNAKTTANGDVNISGNITEIKKGITAKENTTTNKKGSITITGTESATISSALVSDSFIKIDGNTVDVNSSVTSKGRDATTTNGKDINITGNKVTIGGEVNSNNGNVTIGKDGATVRINDAVTGKAGISVVGNSVESKTAGKLTSSDGDISVLGTNVTTSGSITSSTGNVIIGKDGSTTDVKGVVSGNTKVDILGNTITTTGALTSSNGDVNVGNDSTTTTTVEGNVTAKNTADIKATDSVTIKNNTVTADTIKISSKDVVLGDKKAQNGAMADGTDAKIDTKFIAKTTMDVKGTDSTSIWKDVEFKGETTSPDINITSKKIDSEGKITARNITLTGAANDDGTNTSTVNFGGNVSATGDIKATGNDVTTSGTIKTTGANNGKTPATGNITIAGTNTTNTTGSLTTNNGAVNIGVDENGAVVSKTTSVEGDVSGTEKVTVKASGAVTVANGTVSGKGVDIDSTNGTVTLGDGSGTGDTTIKSTDTNSPINVTAKTDLKVNSDAKVGDETTKSDITLKGESITSNGTLDGKAINVGDDTTKTTNIEGNITGAGDVKVTGNDVTTNGEVKSTEGNATVFGSNSTTTKANVSGKTGVSIGTDGTSKSATTSVNADVTSSDGKVNITGTNDVTVANGTVSSGTGTEITGNNVKLGDGQGGTDTKIEGKLDINATEKVTVENDAKVGETTKGEVNIIGNVVDSKGDISGTTTTIAGKKSTTTSGSVSGTDGVNIGKDKNGTLSESTTVSGVITSDNGKVNITGTNDVTVKNGTVSGKGVDIESTTGAVTLGDGSGTGDTTIKSTDTNSPINVTAKTNLKVNSDAKLGDETTKSDITLKGESITSNGTLDGKAINVGDDTTKTTNIEGNITASDKVDVKANKKVNIANSNVSGSEIAVSGGVVNIGDKDNNPKTSLNSTGENKNLTITGTDITIGKDTGITSKGNAEVKGSATVITDGTISGDKGVSVTGNDVTTNGEVKSTEGNATVFGSNSTTTKANVSGKTGVNIGTDGTNKSATTSVNADVTSSDGKVNITGTNDVTVANGTVSGKGVDIESTTGTVTLGDGAGGVDTIIKAKEKLDIKSPLKIEINKDSSLYSENEIDINSSNVLIDGGKVVSEGNINLNTDIKGKNQVTITNNDENRGDVTSNAQLTIGNGNTNLNLINSDITSGVDKGFKTNLDNANLTIDTTSTIDGKKTVKKPIFTIFENIIDAVIDIKEKIFAKGVARQEKVDYQGKYTVENIENKKKVRKITGKGSAKVENNIEK